MDRLNQIRDWFSKTDDVCEQIQDGPEHVKVALKVKRVYMLSRIAYPDLIKESKKVPYVLNGSGMVQGRYGEFDEETVYEEYMMTSSEVTDLLLVYYAHSPFWEIDFYHMVISEYNEEDKLTPEEFLTRCRGCFEDKLIDSLKEGIKGHPLEAFYGMFERDEDCAADDCVVLASFLLPFYHRNRKKLMEIDANLCLEVERAERVLTNWLQQGDSYVIVAPDLEKSYYISDDGFGYSFTYGYQAGYGILDHDISILLAGEVIDRCILALDEKYPFVPDVIKNRKVQKAGGQQC